MRLMVGSYSDNCYQKIGGRSSQSMMKEAVAKSTSFVAVPRSTSSNEVIANFFLSWSWAHSRLQCSFAVMRIVTPKIKFCGEGDIFMQVFT